MKKSVIVLLSILLIQLSLPLLNSLDDQLYVPCGGDNELTIGCFGDDELFFSGSTTQTSGTSDGTSTDDGGTGGGGGGGTTTSVNIKVNTSELNIYLALGQKIDRTLNITNIGSSTITLTPKSENLSSMIVFTNSSIQLSPGESKQITISFIDNGNTGTFNGKIKIRNKEIPVSIIITEEQILFDAKISILNTNSLVNFGENLKALISLIPMGLPKERIRLDVTLNYLIKDYENNTLLAESETLLVEDTTDLEKEIELSSLPEGRYQVFLELIYPNGIATSNAHFEIVKKIVSAADLVFYLIIAILIVMITIVSVIIHWTIKNSR